jgi:uncharacterized protein
MLYRRFGKTNLELSVFSCGTMRCLESIEIFENTLREAIAQGVNHLETAKGYGKSEAYLGQSLQTNLGITRENLYITTKLLPTPDPQKMEQEINESLERLQLDYIDCLAIHGINTWEHLEWITSEHGCWSAIQLALEQGKIRHIGFSTHAPLEIILAAINTNLFEFVNLHYYYFFQRHQAAIELAQQKDMGVFIISPADKGGLLYDPPAKLQELCQPFTPLNLTYRWLLSDRRIATLSFGAANPEEVSSALDIINNSNPSFSNILEPLTLDELAVFTRLENYLTQALNSDHIDVNNLDMNSNPNTDKCSQCYACLPCPGNIAIPEILRLRNLAVAYDMNQYGEYRYGMLENAGHWFPGQKGNRCTECGDCLPRCPEQLDIPHLLKDAHQRLNGSPRRRLWG